jgi:hypothetical protein
MNSNLYPMSAILKNKYFSGTTSASTGNLNRQPMIKPEMIPRTITATQGIISVKQPVVNDLIMLHERYSMTTIGKTFYLQILRFFNNSIFIKGLEFTLLRQKYYLFFSAGETAKQSSISVETRSFDYKLSSSKYWKIVVSFISVGNRLF